MLGFLLKVIGKNNSMKNQKKLYILHGWAYSTEKWEPFVESLKQNGVEAIVLKIPGLTAPLERVWALDDYVEWLKKEISEKDGKVVLLGHSNGGRIALAFAVKYPEKVERLILIDSAGIYHKELALQMKRFVFGVAAKFGKKLTSSPALQKLLYTFAREQDYREASPIVRKTMRNLITSDVTEMLPTIAVPICLIWGENDGITPISDGKIMKQSLPDAHLYIIKNARHSPQFTNAAEVAEIIGEFVIARSE